MSKRFAVVAVVIAWAALAIEAAAAPITELEPNNSLATAQLIPITAFTLPVPATVFNPPGFATATVNGLGSATDVDFYSFTGSGMVYFDVDNDPFTLDTILSLFNSAGTLLAVGDDSFPEDLGSAFGFDAFLGVFDLPAPGTYFIAVSQFDNFATVYDQQSQPNLLRPDGADGGVAIVGAPPGDSSFIRNDGGGNDTASPYTLHISLENPDASVPEPLTILLFGLGLAAIAARSRRMLRKRPSA